MSEKKEFKEYDKWIQDAASDIAWMDVIEKYYKGKEVQNEQQSS